MRFQTLLLIGLLSLPAQVFCADGKIENLMIDNNGDGLVTIYAFGDSVTAGVGDETETGGYPVRLSALIQTPVINGGVAGEVLIREGIERFPASFMRANPDIVFIFEGLNDAWRPQSDSAYQRAVQRLINLTIAWGRTPILVTFPPPAGNHFFMAQYTSGYSSILRLLASINDVPYVDLELAWGTSCENKSACELFNIPEGLHPNALGYTVIAQTMAARLLGIDIFEKNGARKLEKELGLPEAAVIVKPNLLEDER